jgi:5-methylcytosine-specific restriction endonuclease McrA
MIFRLSVELVPSSAWQNNLRSILKPGMWEELRKKVYQKGNFKCAVCNSISILHAHEVWHFDDENKIQILSDVIPLCYMCHMVKHIGYGSLTGGKQLNEKLIKHFMKVNKCERLDFQKHFKKVTGKFNERSNYEWQLDLQKLKDFE